MDCYVARDETYSVIGWPSSHFDLAGCGGALGRVAISLRYCGSVRESWRPDLLYHFGISDYDAAVEGIWKELDDRAAGILYAESIPDSSSRDRFYGAGVCDFLARFAVVSHSGGGALSGEF